MNIDNNLICIFLALNNFWMTFYFNKTTRCTKNTVIQRLYIIEESVKIQKLL